MKTNLLCVKRGAEKSAFHALRSFLAIVFFFAAPIAASSSSAEQQLITLEMRGASAAELIKKVTETTRYRFTFRADDLNTVPRRDYVFSNAGIAQVMDRLISGTDLEWSEDGGTLFLSLKPAPRQTTVPAAQPAEVTGRVMDEDGKPIFGVAVVVKGTTTGTSTNLSGEFTLRVPGAGTVLEFSFVGLEKQELIYNGQQSITVYMKDSASDIDQVVVTGYQNIAKGKMTGSAVTISEQSLQDRYTPNLLDNLEGKAPGLIVYDGKMQIRGTSTLQAETQPLLVVDGLPIEGRLEDINPYDIASVNVLKDAAAAAIYGARASNGVIVITTKSAPFTGDMDISGKRQVSVDVSANMTVYDKRNTDYKANGYLTPAEQVEFERGYYYEHFFDNKGLLPNPVSVFNQNFVEGNRYASEVAIAYYELAKGDINQSQLDARLEELKKNNFAKDFSKHVLQKRMLQQYNVAVRSRTKDFQSNLVMNYKHDRGEIKKGSDSQVNIFYKGSYNMARWLTVNVGIDGILQRSNQSNSEFFALSGDISSISNPYFLRPAYTAMFNPDGSYASYSPHVYINRLNTNTSDHPGLASDHFNHAQELNYDRRIIDRQRLRYQGELVFRIMDGLTANTLFIYETERTVNSAYSEAESFSHRFLRNTYTDLNDDGTYSYLFPEAGGRLTKQNLEGNYWTGRGQLNFSRTFADRHSVDVIAGLEFRQTRSKGINTLLFGYDDQHQTDGTLSVNFDALRDMGRRAQIYIPNYYTAYNSYLGYIENNLKVVPEEYHRYASAYFNATYTYGNRYNVFGSFRKDYADIYGLDGKFRGKPLWSVGAGWNLHNEAFLSELDWLTFLKLRTSYGVTGNIDNSVTSRLTAVSAGYNSTTQLPMSKINSPANDRLKWEKTKTTNVGLDFAFMNNRLRGTFDYYNKLSSDVLAVRILDEGTGFTSIIMNNANMKNHGFEVLLAYEWFRARNRDQFSWTTSMTSTFNKNKVTKVQLAQSNARTLVNLGYREGTAVNTLFSYKWVELNSIGEPVFLLPDGRTLGFQIESYPEALMVSGQSDPKLAMAMENHLRYKGFSLNVMMVYYGGHKMRTRPYGPFGYFDILNTALYDHYPDTWRPDRTDTNVPAMGIYGSQILADQVNKNADIFVRSANFLKIRNIVMGYDLPDRLVSKAGFKHVSLRFQIDNPKYLWVNNNLGVDPETLSIRRPTSYIFGLNFSF